MLCCINDVSLLIQSMINGGAVEVLCSLSFHECSVIQQNALWALMVHQYSAWTALQLLMVYVCVYVTCKMLCAWYDMTQSFCCEFICFYSCLECKLWCTFWSEGSYKKHVDYGETSWVCGVYITMRKFLLKAWQLSCTLFGFTTFTLFSIDWERNKLSSICVAFWIHQWRRGSY